jgi:lipoate-protein ligase A
MRLSFIKSLPATGSENMEKDLEIFEKVENFISPSTLRFYQWAKPCISLGYSQNPENFLDILECGRNGLEVVRRPTGGGICFHNQDEITLSFSFAREKTSYKSLRENLHFLPQIILQVLINLGIKAEFKKGEVEKKKKQIPFCFAVPIVDEIVVNNKKVVGFAQKITKKAVLQQGTIMIKNNFDEFISVIANSAQAPETISSVMTIGIEEILGRKVHFDQFCDLVEDMVYYFSP